MRTEAPETGLDSCSDDELMKRFQNGEVEGFEVLVERYRPCLARFLLTLGAGVSNVDDLVQDTFMRVYEHYRDYIPMGTFRPWIYRIARNLHYDKMRERVPVPMDLDMPIVLLKDWRGSTQLAALEKRETESERWRRIRAACDGLPETMREALYLRYELELTIREIAEIQDCPEGSVKSKLHYAVKRLQDRVAGDKIKLTELQ
jgi:RNA polymerase sigma-70 factor (ECF subfamily)